jgi:hypothetical protein
MAGWWLIFVVMPAWAGESKPVPPQSNPVSTSCKQVDNNVVKKWKEEVKKFQKSLPSTATRGGGELEISSPLFFSIFSPQNAKILAGKRKIHLAWEGGQKRYRVKIFPSGRPWVWTLSNLQDAWVSSEEKEFKTGENYWVVVTDDNDNESKWKFTAVDLESQPFAKQFSEIQKDTSLNEVQKKWRLATLLVSCGEEWKLEAYQQIAEQPKERESDEFYWGWLGMKYGIVPAATR